MKNTSLVVVIAIVILAALDARAQRAEGNSDLVAIKAVVSEMEAGWNRKNGDEFARSFAEDCDYVVINGMHIKGRRAVAEGHQRIFDTIYKNSSLKTTVEGIRFLSPEIAIVHVRADLTVFEKDSSATTGARLTLVMRRQDAKWWTTAFQNTRIAG